MARVLLAKARFAEKRYGDDGVVPPLGAMYIASVLREAGHEVRLFDVGVDWRNLDPFRDALRRFRPQVVGLSAITIEARSMEAMAVATREVLPGVPIMVGGPHATAYPERCARHPAIDYVILGEGERTAVELVEALTRGNRDPAAIHGLAFRGPPGEVIQTPERGTIEDVDGIPFPAWDLIDIDYYSMFGPMSGTGRRRYMLLFTSRGCPFKCIYCHEVQGKRFRSRSPENVLAEIEVLRDRFGINDFEVIDDIFNFDRERMLEILGRIRRLSPRPSLHFPNALRTDILDEKQIIALRESGTTSLSVAVETTSQRLQKLTKKHLKVDRVRQNIDIAVRQGMFVRGFFMLGFPTETYEEARATVDFALATPLHHALFFIVTPFAGTALYEIYQDLLRQRGVEVDFPEMQYMTGTHNLSEIPDQQLFALQRSAFRRFYLNPKRLARIAYGHPRRTQLVRGFLPFLQFLKRQKQREAPAMRVPAPPAAGRPVDTEAVGLPLKAGKSLQVLSAAGRPRERSHEGTITAGALDPSPSSVRS